MKEKPVDVCCPFTETKFFSREWMQIKFLRFPDAASIYASRSSCNCAGNIAWNTPEISHAADWKAAAGSSAHTQTSLSSPGNADFPFASQTVHEPYGDNDGGQGDPSGASQPGDTSPRSTSVVSDCEYPD